MQSVVLVRADDKRQSPAFWQLLPHFILELHLGSTCSQCSGIAKLCPDLLTSFWLIRSCWCFSSLSQQLVQLKCFSSLVHWGFFYSVELSATVLQKYSFAFYCLKCMFRMASCLKAFALKHWGSEKAESMLTLLVKVAFNFYSTFHRKLPQNTNCLPAFQEWCMFHDNFWIKEDIGSSESAVNPSGNKKNSRGEKTPKFMMQLQKLEKFVPFY